MIGGTATEPRSLEREPVDRGRGDAPHPVASPARLLRGYRVVAGADNSSPYAEIFHGKPVQMTVGDDLEDAGHGFWIWRGDSLEAARAMRRRVASYPTKTTREPQGSKLLEVSYDPGDVLGERRHGRGRAVVVRKLHVVRELDTAETAFLSQKRRDGTLEVRRLSAEVLA